MSSASLAKEKVKGNNTVRQPLLLASGPVVGPTSSLSAGLGASGFTANSPGASSGFRGPPAGPEPPEEEAAAWLVLAAA